MADLGRVFEASDPSLDLFTKSKRRTAARRIGAPTSAAQHLLDHVKRDCPWQLYEDPETGRTQIERRYDPADEPLLDFTYFSHNPVD